MASRQVPFLLAVALLAAAGLLPFFAGGFVLSMLTLVFLYAYLGQAWNIIMGLAGQLSLGHGLFVGIGGYTVAVLSVRYGINAWLGVAAGAALSALVASVIGFLGFRFAVRGIYFALLTIAFAELIRILFDNWMLIGGAGGFFLPVLDPAANPLVTLRGGAVYFYYASLVLMLLGTALAFWLMRTRLGFVWRAIRDDEDAARALGVQAFRMKIGAAALSAAMTSVGGSLLALMNGSLFPDTMMGMGMSIQLILAPIIGGLGTALGPLVGALFVIPITELSNQLGQSLGIFGLNMLTYGVVMFLVINFMANGIWPGLCGLAAQRSGRCKPRESLRSRRYEAPIT